MVLFAILLFSSMAWAGSKAPTVPTDGNTDLAAALRSGKPVIAKLGADWCQPCRAMKPVLKELAKEQAGRMIVLDLDINQNRRLAGQYKITLIPTTLFYSRSGLFKGKKTGFMSKTDLLNGAREFGLIK